MLSKASAKDPKAAAGRREGPYFSKIIEKGFRILGLFTPETTSLSLTDIARQTRINPTSTFRFVETLVQLGYLRKDARAKLIKLGPMALALSYNIIKSFDVLQIVKPAVDEAFERHNVSIDTAVTEHGRLVLLYRREVKDTLTFTLPFVSSDLQCSALGKAYLAALPDKELRALLDGMTFVRRTVRSLRLDLDRGAPRQQGRRRPGGRLVRHHHGPAYDRRGRSYSPRPSSPSPKEIQSLLPL